VEPQPRPGPPPAGGGSATATADQGDDARDQAPWQREDRWAWRRRIRSDPHKYRIYRVLVAVVGTLLILLGAATGWLPGPGGIPLALLGLAVLASEFEWAHRLLQWAKRKAHEAGERARRQPRWVRWLGGLGTAAGVVVAVWLGLALLGVPGWVPGQVAATLEGLPGIG
jgi:uncharacterized protein (TIGR02611 family)